MSAKLEIDSGSRNKLFSNLDQVAKKIPAATYEAIVVFLFNAKSLAQNRIKEKKHIVTSRLRNSIYVKSNAKLQDQRTYSDNEGNTFNGDLSTVTLKEQEAAVGTNVEYAEKIERLDSFLYWGVQNADDKEFVKAYNKEVNKIPLKK